MCFCIFLHARGHLCTQVIKAAEDASGAERSFLLLERRADAEREENRCLGAQKDLRISDLEKQVCGLQKYVSEGVQCQGRAVCPAAVVASGGVDNGSWFVFWLQSVFTHVYMLSRREG